MRAFLVAFSLIVLLIASIPLYLVSLLIKVFNKRASAALSQAVVHFILRVALLCAGARITVHGVENIPTDRSVLFVTNHRSYADSCLEYITLPVLAGSIAKKELGKVPILSWWMKGINCLFLDRDDLRQGLKTILSAVDLVKDGYSIIVAPEGTRNHSEELLPFKEGCFKIAEKSGCPIIPVALSNTDALYELHAPTVKSAKVAIRYGEPIPTEGLSRDEMKQVIAKVRERITEMLEEDKVYVN